MFTSSSRLVYWAIAALFMAAYIVRLGVAGFALPVPWPDESSFLWQAIAFQRHTNFFAPELNAMRDIMWMPPGYMIIIGSIFKITGVSFSVARIVSSVCMIGSFVALAAVLKKYSYAFASLIILGFLFLTLPFIGTGNMARMDAMMLLIAAMAILFFERRNDLAAISLLALSPLIHPNGVFFIAAAAVFLSLEHRWKLFKRNRATVVAAVCIVFCWGLYALYVAGHWDDFLTDMSHQLHRKADRSIFLFAPFNLTLFIAVLLSVYYSHKKKLASPLLACFGIGLWMLHGIGEETWYQCFLGVAVVLLLNIELPVIIALLHKFFPTFHLPRLRTGIACVIIVVIALIGYRMLNFQKSPLQPFFGSWAGMRVEDRDVPYLTAEDKSAVRAYLSSLQLSKEPVNIKWFPEADAIFFADMETGNIHFCQGTFYSFAPTISIIHATRYLSTWWSGEILSRIAECSGTPGEPLFTRDSTEAMIAGKIGVAQR